MNEYQQRHLTERKHQLFNDSYDRCKADPKFMQRFETYFLESSKEVRNRFEGVDMRTFRAMIQSSLPFLILANLNESALERTVRNHQGMNIPPALYELWLESMLLAVERTDPKFDNDVAEAWRAVVDRGIGLMKGSQP